VKKIALIALVAATLGGCVVYPAGPYYGPRAYYGGPPVVVEPGYGYGNGYYRRGW